MQNEGDKVLELLKKLNTPLALPIILGIIGVLFIVLPISILEIVFVIVGIGLLIFSVAKLAINAKEKQSGVFHTIKIVRDALLISLGFAMVFWRSALLSMLCRIVGGIISAFSGYKIYGLTRHNEKRDTRWGFTLAFTIVLMVVGISLFSYPIFPDIMIGIALVILSVRLILDAKKKDGKENDNADDGVYYTDDFVDKSDK